MVQVHLSKQGIAGDPAQAHQPPCALPRQALPLDSQGAPQVVCRQGRGQERAYPEQVVGQGEGEDQAQHAPQCVVHYVRRQQQHRVATGPEDIVGGRPVRGVEQRGTDEPTKPDRVSRVHVREAREHRGEVAHQRPSQCSDGEQVAQHSAEPLHQRIRYPTHQPGPPAT